MTGVLLAQVGTPDEPTPRAVRRYLRRFLMDRRVVDYSPLWWRPFLECVILPRRAHRSAALYRRIWSPEGSPLLVYSERQRALLQDRLGSSYQVTLGMAYGGPPIGDALDRLIAGGCDTAIVVPMFPQYASATTGSIYDAVTDALRYGPSGTRWFAPALQFVPPFYGNRLYLAAVQARIAEAVAAQPEPPDHIVLTFHGLPQRFVDSGDPYRSQCETTVRLLVELMQWRAEQVTVCFQSRFGPERWLEPDTAGVLRGLAARGIRRPLVVAPGFTTDCLETLDELGHEGRAAFVAGGGSAGAFALVPCLNDSPAWIAALANFVASTDP